MSQVTTFIKIAGAWICLIAACAILILTRDVGLATALGVASIAFSEVPA